MSAREAALRSALTTLPAEPLARLMPVLLGSFRRFSALQHGDFERWQAAIMDLPDLAPEAHNTGARVQVEGNCSPAAQQQLRKALEQLRPWRKGPFSVFGVDIDTEWRSDWKWQRLASALPNLRGQRVLDVGCGNGYFGWRLLQAGAETVLGIDPTLLFCMQHLAINRYFESDQNWVLPLRLEELPTGPESDLGFDGVLSMGVIYHRRNPLEHVQQLTRCLRPGGWLVLESLIVEGDTGIFPGETGGRYARMRNVWCVPTIAMLEQWLQECGFSQVALLDNSITSTDEQRTTPWMTFESLAQALDPEDPHRTVEGWPRPRRAVLMARAGG